MDVAWYCRCCYSADSLEILSGPQLNVYLLIYNTKGTEDDHKQIAVCPQCREFLKDVHRFRIELHGADEIIDHKIDAKELVLRNMTDDNPSQMRIKTEIIDVCYEMETEGSHIVDGHNQFQDSVNLAKDNLLTVLNDVKTKKSNDGSAKRLSKMYNIVNSDETVLGGHKLFSCKICNRRYTLRKSLYAHMALHLNDKNKVHNCSKCSYTTVYKASLRSHIASKHSDEKPFSCDKCDYHCKLKHALLFHIKSHTNDSENSHKCSECSFTTVHKGSLKDHIEAKHSDERNFPCDMCNYRCKTKRHLSSHLKGHLNPKEKPHKCSECSYASTHKGSLKTHIASKHTFEKPFSCDTCDYRCTNKQSLFLHTRNHSNGNEESYKCSECSFTTAYKGSLKIHIASRHSDEKPFFCNVCGYRSKVKYELSRHMKAHLDDNDKPHKCNECSYTTIYKSRLNEHILAKHSDEKPLSCDICGYRCKKKRSLILHIRKHLNVNDKPHKCSECSYTTIHKGNLKNHIAFKHRDERPFSCDKCGCRFKRKQTLSTHVISHLNLNEKPHKCSECSFGTTRKDRLTRHIVIKHSLAKTKIEQLK